MKWMTVPVLILVALLSACEDAPPLPTSEVPISSPTQEFLIATETHTPSVPPRSIPTREISQMTPQPTIQGTPKPPPRLTTPVQLDELPLFQEVRDYLARQQAVSPEKVVLISFEPVIWPDSCLGLASPGETCLTVETRGYLLFFETPAGQVEAHLDSSGRNFRLVPPATP